MLNIKFPYLYRDSGNYKRFGSVVFSNPTAYSLLEIEAIIRSKLIDELWFYANEWQVPDLFFDAFNPYNDPIWHEFENIEFTEDHVNWGGPIAQRLRRAS